MINKEDSIGDAMGSTRASLVTISSSLLFPLFTTEMSMGIAAPSFPLCRSSIYLFIYVLILSSIAEYNGQ